MDYTDCKRSQLESDFAVLETVRTILNRAMAEARDHRARLHVVNPDVLDTLSGLVSDAMADTIGPEQTALEHAMDGVSQAIAGDGHVLPAAHISLNSRPWG